MSSAELEPGRPALCCSSAARDALMRSSSITHLVSGDTGKTMSSGEACHQGCYVSPRVYHSGVRAESTIGSSIVLQTDRFSFQGLPKAFVVGCSQAAAHCLWRQGASDMAPAPAAVRLQPSTSADSSHVLAPACTATHTACRPTMGGHKRIQQT